MDTRLLIKRLGGGAKVASLCEVTPAAVSQWIANGVPPARLMYLKLARPEAFVNEAVELVGAPECSAAPDAT